MMPLVSIIIPTYNRAHFIGQTLDSVIRQSYNHWECLIIDDGSIDYTSELIEFYCQKDNRFIFISRPKHKKKGASSCRNYGLLKAQGDYIQFLDSDDILSSNKLELQVENLNINSQFSLATCKWGRFKIDDSDANFYLNFKSYKNFDDISHFFECLSFSEGFLPIHAYLIRSSLIKESGNWNEDLTLNDDGEFIIRVLLKSSKIVYTQNCYVLYRYSFSSGNLSCYSDENEIRKSLLSIRLMENQLKIRYGEKTFVYIEKIKKEFFLQILDFPNIIKENKDFFNRQIRFYSKKAKLKRKLLKYYTLWKNL